MTSLFEFQKNIFSIMKERALEYEGETSEELLDFRRNLELYAQRETLSVSEKELFNDLSVADIIYLGDFHTFDQNVKNLMRLVKHLFSHSQGLVIGLEMIDFENFSTLNSYLLGDLTEFEFLEQINYSQSWRFPWSHYKEIFDFCIKNKVSLVPLNSKGSLAEREDFAANVIKEEKEKHPNKSFLILFGELHLAPNKLPLRVKEVIGDGVNSLIIHQNLDQTYWNSLDHEEKVDDFQILKFSNEEYCLISSPPWMKYESMCYWFEGLMDDVEFELHEYIVSKGYKLFSENPQDSFVEIKTRIYSFLGIKNLEFDQNVYDHKSLDYVKSLSEKSSFTKIYEECLTHNHSFCSLDGKFIYCANYSINEVARLAGFDLVLRSFDKQELLVKDKQFLGLFLIHAHLVSYLIAKILNPFLKCDLYLDLEKKKQGKELLTFIRNPDLDTFDHLQDVFNFSKILGSLIGDYVYGVLDADQVKLGLGTKILKDYIEIDYLKSNLFLILKNYLSKKELKLQKKRVF